MIAKAPRLTTGLAEELVRIVGDDAVITDPARLMVYESDGLTAYRYPPRAVVLPRDGDETARVVRAITAERVPFVARGSGTGLSGGALAVDGAVVVCTARMNRILELDLHNRRARIQPGVVNAHLTAATRPHGLYYAPDPSSQSACSVGGNVAENSGGPHCLKYGVTSRYIRGTGRGAGGRQPRVPGRPRAGHRGTRPRGALRGIGGLLRHRGGDRCRTAAAAAGDAHAARHLRAAGGRGAGGDRYHRGRPAPGGARDHRPGHHPGRGGEHLRRRLSDGRGGRAGGGSSTASRRGSRPRPRGRRRRAWSAGRARCGGPRPRMRAPRSGRAGRRLSAPWGGSPPDLLVQDATVPRTRLPDVPGQDRADRRALRPQGGQRLPRRRRPTCTPTSSSTAATPPRWSGWSGPSKEIMRICVEAGGTITGEHGVGLDKRDYMSLIHSDDTLWAMESVRPRLRSRGPVQPGQSAPGPDPQRAPGGRRRGWQ